MTLLDVAHASWAYGDRTVLHDVSAHLDEGERVALLGANGAGKTTLMRLLVGALKPQSGTVSGVSGRRLGWVPQGGATWSRLTVRENLEIFAQLLKLDGDARQIAQRASRAAELDPWLDTPASDLSGGLRQRLNVAVGVLGDPRVLVLDEPTTGVDLVHRTALFRMLDTRARAGAAVLYSTHALEDAARADRVIVLSAGAVQYDGPFVGIAEQAPAPGATVDAYLDRATDIERGLLQLWRHHEDRGEH